MSESNDYENSRMYENGRKDAKTTPSRRKSEQEYVVALENDLKRAIGLLHLANPDNRAWVEARDAFLEEMGAFKEPEE